MAISFKKDQNKIGSLNWYWYVLMVERSIRGRICHSIDRCTKTNTKYKKDHDKNKELSYL